MTELHATAPARLDHFLRDALPHLSLRHLRRLANEGAIRINGKVARKGDRVRSGDSVTVPGELVATKELRAQPELALALLFEDDHLVAVDKPSGMPSIAQSVGDTRTAANFLIGRFPETRELDPRGLEAGFVHRLDTATSGVMVAARTAHGYRSLRTQFRGGKALKTYNAVVVGAVGESGVLSQPIQARPGDPTRVEVVATGTAGSRPAETRFRLLSTTDSISLVEVAIHSGSRHQIRAHLAAGGHPILGDTIYGEAGAERLLLHARSVVLEHPVSGTSICIQAPIPPAFTRIWEDSSGLTGWPP